MEALQEREVFKKNGYTRTRGNENDHDRENERHVKSIFSSREEEERFSRYLTDATRKRQSKVAK